MEKLLWGLNRWVAYLINAVLVCCVLGGLGFFVYGLVVFVQS